MSRKQITAGEKTGKAIAMRMIKSEKKGTVAFEVQFEFMEQSTGAIETLEWQGWRTVGANEWTAKHMLVLEYNGSKTLDRDGKFTDQNVINFDKEYRLTVAVETNEVEGKIYNNPKIQWINELGGSQYTGLSPEVMKSPLNDGFDAAFAAAKAKVPAKPALKNHAPGADNTPQFNAKEEIPF